MSVELLLELFRLVLTFSAVVCALIITLVCNGTPGFRRRVSVEEVAEELLLWLNVDIIMFDLSPLALIWQLYGC